MSDANHASDPRPIAEQIAGLYPDADAALDRLLLDLIPLLKDDGIEVPADDLRAYAREMSGSMDRIGEPRPAWWVIDSCLVDGSCYEGLIRWLARDRGNEGAKAKGEVR